MTLQPGGSQMHPASIYAPGSLRTRDSEPEFVESLREADLVFAVPTQQPGLPYLLYPAQARMQDPVGHHPTAEVLKIPVDLLTDDLDVLARACLRIKGGCAFDPNSREFEAFLAHECEQAVQVDADRCGVKDRRRGGS
jgi:hypothetical protein